MNAIPDKFAQWDAAYVLGALSPAERREFEEHLASCPSCQAAVSDLAALPGLLAQLSPDDAAMLSMADETVAGSAETPVLSAVQTDVIEQGPPPSLLPKMIK
ncbi:MAG: anti-sigma factor family protein, partial [Propionibacteriaceae bacterium]